MATRRKSTRRRRERARPRVPSHAVRAARAPDPLPLATPLIREIRAEFDMLIATVMSEVDPILLGAGARRFDAVSVRDLFRLLQNRFNPIAMLRRLFRQVEAEVTDATARAIPQVAIPAVLSNGAQLQEAWVRANTDLIKAAEPIKDIVRDVLENRLEAGTRVEVIREQLRERLEVSKRRAELIARDQVLKASGQLQEARQRQAGVTRYVWTTSLDERVRPDHAMLEGRIFSWDDPPITNASEVRMGRPERRGHPGSDFQCFPGSHRVLLPDSVRSAFRRWYCGELAEFVTDAGETIQCTPNHPILTSTGWVAAKAVKVGDDVIQTRFDRSHFAETDIQDRIPRISDVFEAFALLFKTHRVDAVASQFHGDGQRSVGHEHVQVVYVQGELGHHVEPACAKPGAHFDLADTDAPGFGLRYADAVLYGFGLTAASGISGLRLRLARYFVNVCKPEHVCHRDAANLQPGALERGTDGCARDAEAIRKRLDRGACQICVEASALVERLRVMCAPTRTRRLGKPIRAERLGHVVGCAAQGGGDFSPGPSLRSKRTRVSEVRRVVFSGHVYNLQTECNWYVAQGLCVHNCRCTADPVLDDPEFEPDEQAGQP